MSVLNRYSVLEEFRPPEVRTVLSKTDVIPRALPTMDISDQSRPPSSGGLKQMFEENCRRHLMMETEKVVYTHHLPRTNLSENVEMYDRELPRLIHDEVSTTNRQSALVVPLEARLASNSTTYSSSPPLALATPPLPPPPPPPPPPSPPAPMITSNLQSTNRNVIDPGLLIAQAARAIAERANYTKNNPVKRQTKTPVVLAKTPMTFMEELQRALNTKRKSLDLNSNEEAQLLRTPFPPVIAAKPSRFLQEAARKRFVAAAEDFEAEAEFPSDDGTTQLEEAAAGLQSNDRKTELEEAAAELPSNDRTTQLEESATELPSDDRTNQLKDSSFQILNSNQTPVGSSKQVIVKECETTTPETEHQVYNGTSEVVTLNLDVNHGVNQSTPLIIDSAAEDNLSKYLKSIHTSFVPDQVNEPFESNDLNAQHQSLDISNITRHDSVANDDLGANDDLVAHNFVTRHKLVKSDDLVQKNDIVDSGIQNDVDKINTENEEDRVLKLLDLAYTEAGENTFLNLYNPSEHQDVQPTQEIVANKDSFKAAEQPPKQKRFDTPIFRQPNYFKTDHPMPNFSNLQTTQTSVEALRSPIISPIINSTDGQIYSTIADSHDNIRPADTGIHVLTLAVKADSSELPVVQKTSNENKLVQRISFPATDIISPARSHRFIKNSSSRLKSIQQSSTANKGGNESHDRTLMVLHSNNSMTPTVMEARPEQTLSRGNDSGSTYRRRNKYLSKEDRIFQSNNYRRPNSFSGNNELVASDERPQTIAQEVVNSVITPILQEQAHQPGCSQYGVDMQQKYGSTQSPDIVRNSTENHDYRQAVYLENVSPPTVNDFMFQNSSPVNVIAGNQHAAVIDNQKRHSNAISRLLKSAKDAIKSMSLDNNKSTQRIKSTDVNMPVTSIEIPSAAFNADILHIETPRSGINVDTVPDGILRGGHNTETVVDGMPRAGYNADTVPVQSPSRSRPRSVNGILETHSLNRLSTLYNSNSFGMTPEPTTTPLSFALFRPAMSPFPQTQSRDASPGFPRGEVRYALNGGCLQTLQSFTTQPTTPAVFQQFATLSSVTGKYVDSPNFVLESLAPLDVSGVRHSSMPSSPRLLTLQCSSPIRSGAGIAVFGDDWLPTPPRSALPAATLQTNGYDTRM